MLTEPIPMTPTVPSVVDKLERIGWANFSVLIPLAAIVSFDRLFSDVGLGLQAGVAVAMGYAFYILRRSIARGRRRRGLDTTDPNDRLEECSDYLSDFSPVAVLVFVTFWLFTPAPLYLEAGYFWYAVALTLGMGVAGVSAIAGLHEGMQRLLTCIRAKDELTDWDPSELLDVRAGG